MHHCFYKANLLILHPDGKKYTSPIQKAGWYILYGSESAEPDSYYLDAGTDLLISKLSFEPRLSNCADVANSREVGLCKVTLAFTEEEPNTYGNQTFEAGSGQNMLTESGRVVYPYAEPYPYDQQQVFGYYKYHGFFESSASKQNLDFTHQVLLTARQVSTPRMPLKVFGTPILVTYRVLQKQQNKTQITVSSVSTSQPLNLKRIDYGLLPETSNQITGFLVSGQVGNRSILQANFSFFGDFTLPEGVEVSYSDGSIIFTLTQDVNNVIILIRQAKSSFPAIVYQPSSFII